MPTTYAHWRFGQDCIDELNPSLKEIINNNRDIFNIGVHGPDIFFYDLTHSEVTHFGSKMHDIPAGDFFVSTKAVYESHEEKEMMLAYLLGFLTHFTLDSTCHGYIDRKKEVSGVSHNKIESEWDGHLMSKDGRLVNLVDRSESLRPNKENARVISYFFPFDEKTILRTTKRQHTVIKALNYISVRKYNFWQGLLKKLKLNDFADLMISPNEDVNCMDSNLRLDKLREVAKSRYPKLVKNFMSYLNGDIKELDKYFEHDFEPWPDYQNIPILSIEEEINYKVKK